MSDPCVFGAIIRWCHRGDGPQPIESRVVRVTPRQVITQSQWDTGPHTSHRWWKGRLRAAVRANNATVEVSDG